MINVDDDATHHCLSNVNIDITAAACTVWLCRRSLFPAVLLGYVHNQPSFADGLFRAHHAIVCLGVICGMYQVKRLGDFH